MTYHRGNIVRHQWSASSNHTIIFIYMCIKNNRLVFVCTN